MASFIGICGHDIRYCSCGVRPGPRSNPDGTKEELAEVLEKGYRYLRDEQTPLAKELCVHIKKVLGPYLENP